MGREVEIKEELALEEAVFFTRQPKFGYIIRIILTGGGPTTRASIVSLLLLLLFVGEGRTGKANAKARCLAADAGCRSSRDAEAYKSGSIRLIARH